MVLQNKRPAIFLDRDGVIVTERDFSDIGIAGPRLTRKEDIEIYPGVKEALLLFKRKGFLIIVITNQSIVGSGVITTSVLNAVNSEINTALGGIIDSFYCCTHRAEANCSCRKPKTGLIDRAVAEWGIDLSRSWLIGDKTSDIQTGQNAGIQTVLVKTGYGGRDRKYDATPLMSVDTISDAAVRITATLNFYRIKQ